ncbi:DUF554 domain-containing protein [Desulfovibrio litoralis]|uniref:DUF554 domain-containing protein n=1 Tax=Desulfovibrio litoralis DSM 11393 TaxID=1121455 RepID=A0A1M7SZD4_9BACT|nr:DUF554 domain-containing protein [Desulfovibrio litoralis]SHN63796.1 hypothetical protein SAMN02745728_01407 [Desulfovibrio litoralis DSM 11393]
MQFFLPIGTSVNAIAIILGCLIGMLIGGRLKDEMRKIVFQALGLSVFIIGLKMALKSNNMLIMVFSMLLGGILGQLLNIEGLFNKGGNKLKNVLKSNNSKFTEGFVSSTILFAVGSMAILGSFNEGIDRDPSLLYTKATLDFFAAVALGSTMGIGVAFSALPVFIYQGILTLCAAQIKSLLTADMQNEMIATGGILILGIGFNLLNLLKIPLSNFLPSIIFAVVLTYYFI